MAPPQVEAKSIKDREFSARNQFINPAVRHKVRGERQQGKDSPAGQAKAALKGVWGPRDNWAPVGNVFSFSGPHFARLPPSRACVANLLANQSKEQKKIHNMSQVLKMGICRIYCRVTRNLTCLPLGHTPLLPQCQSATLPGCFCCLCCLFCSLNYHNCAVSGWRLEMIMSAPAFPLLLTTSRPTKAGQSLDLG